MAAVTLGPTVPPLQPHTPVLTLPDNRLRIGGGPTDGIVIELREGADATAVAALLRWLNEPRPRDAVLRRARQAGLTRYDVAVIVHALADAGKLADDASSRVTAADTTRLRVAIEGFGPLASALHSTLPAAGIGVVPRSVSAGDVANLVVLSDHLVHAPGVVAELMHTRTPHLPVYVRDGVGILGPLVLPGLSSCLNCADQHRTTLEPAWPIIAGQLVGKAGTASGAIIRATAALTHEHIEQLALSLAAPSDADLSGRRPQLENQVLELHPAPMRLISRRWTTHPLCGCRDHIRFPLS